MALTPQDAGARITVIRTTIATIDTQAAVIVAKLIAARAELVTLAAQRQPLVSEASAIMADLLDAPWRADLDADANQP